MSRLAFEDIPKVIVSDAERRCCEKALNTIPDGPEPSVRIGTADLLDFLKEEDPDADPLYLFELKVLVRLEWCSMPSHNIYVQHQKQ